jgi:hypothetical protein
VNISIKGCAIIAALCQMLSGYGFAAQDQPREVQPDHAAMVRTLSDQLRWHDEAGSKQYDTVKDDLTRRLLDEVDAYIADSFDASSATAAQVKAGLDALLGIKEGGLTNQFAFTANLPSGHFLIVGVELLRGGQAISEDAISFRAYEQAGKSYRLVSSTANLSDSSLVALHALALPSPPIAGQFWIMAWADVPPRSPFTIAMRLYAFDGKEFRTVWAPGEIISESINNAVSLDRNGELVISEMPDWHSSTVVEKRYALTADGPKKVSETSRDRK